MTKDNNGINHTDSQEHRSLVDSMAPFLDNGKPKLGIFWYDVANQSLFGVEKMDAEQATFVNGRATIGKLHKTYWQKQHLSGAQLHAHSPWPSLPRREDRPLLCLRWQLATRRCGRSRSGCRKTARTAGGRVQPTRGLRVRSRLPLGPLSRLVGGIAVARTCVR